MLSIEFLKITRMVKQMKKRTFEQIQLSKAIYKKHAERHKAAHYPHERASRMLAYTAALTKAINVACNRGKNHGM